MQETFRNKGFTLQHGSVQLERWGNGPVIQDSEMADLNGLLKNTALPNSQKTFVKQLLL